MKKKLLLAPLLLGLMVLGDSRQGLAGSSDPIPADLFERLETEGWTEVRPGVMQRTLEGNKVETLGFGTEGLRFHIEQMKARLAFFKKEHASHPSRGLRVAIRAYRAQILRLEAVLREEAKADRLGLSTDAVRSAGTTCLADYDSAVETFPAAQGAASANASAYFYNQCGYNAEVLADAYVQLTNADNAVVTMTKVDPGPNRDSYRFGGNVSASASVALSGGVRSCYSSAHASVTSFDFEEPVSYALADESTSPNCAGGSGAFAVDQHTPSVEIGVVGVGGSTTFANGTITVNAGGTDLWETADAFRFVHQDLTGDGEIVAKISGLTVPAGANWALAGVTFRDALTTDSVHATMMITSDGKAKFRRRTTIGGTTLSDGPSIGTTLPPRWLKLVRSGNVFTAFLSTDGVAWTQVHTPQTVPMGPTVRVGLVALRNANASTVPTGQATFEQVTVRPMPAPWQTADVGTLRLAGKASVSAGTWTIEGAGTDIWDTADSFRYVYQPLFGDGEIVANVTGLTLPQGPGWSTAAVMIREKLTAGSVHASMMITSDGKAKFRRRATEGGATLSDGPMAGTTYPPRWLRITRAGNVFTAYISTDGVAWTQIHTPQTVVMPANVWIGLLVLRNGDAPPATATIRDVQVVP